MGIASLIFVALLAVSIAHLIWSIGRTWPLRDEALLARTVNGRRGVTHMPNRLISLIVSVAVLAAGVIALALADHTAGGVWLSALGGLLALIFVARGVIGYTPGWRAHFPEEPFATLDRKNYSPLCLLLGVGFIALVIMRLI